jgi:YidC/Oxa1 family membrane protein insertase
MSHGIFSSLFYIPVYNALIFLINTLPYQSAALAVILLTLVIRLILFPLSRKSIVTQLQMKQIEPDVERIKRDVKDRQEQAKQLMKLYNDKDINPFAGFFLILIQFPVLIGLYRVFRSGLPKVDASLLYGFIHMPAAVNMHLFTVDIASKSFILAALVVITQFIQLNISLPKSKKVDNASFQQDLAHSMNTQMKYIIPIILFPVAYISAVLALYLLTSNLFMIGQEFFVRRRLAKRYVTPAAI